MSIPPAGAMHGKIAMRLGRYLGNFVEEQGLGEVYAAGTGFTIMRAPDTVRAPDVTFVSHANQLVWLVDPQTRTVTVYASLTQAHMLLEDDVLDGRNVVPGFKLPLAQLFKA